MNRRRFLQSTAAFTALPSLNTLAVENTAPKIRLGMDHFALRSSGWKASQLIEYAASLKLDTLFISELGPFESFEDSYLKGLRIQADKAEVALYIGTKSVCPTAKMFKDDHGTAEEHLSLVIRTAKILGSPVARCVLGANEDRKRDGGITRHIEALVKVFKACKNQAQDAGIQISVENHAGDMQSHELVGLVEAAGKEYVGVNIDPGNATWVMEDPLRHLEILGPYTNCSSVRDSMIWESEDGAVVQWTAIGDGLVDFKAYAKRFGELCPGVPLQIETISGFAKPLPFKKPEFIKELGYEKMPAEDLAAFVALSKKGKAIPPYKAPDKEAELVYQKEQLNRSITALRSYGVGVKPA